MGLDNFAIYPEKDTRGKFCIAADEFFKGIYLTGGLQSGGADSASFRGKVYSAEVQEWADISLYKDPLSPKEVKIIGERLEIALKTYWFAQPDEDKDFVNKKAMIQLAKWFRLATDYGFGLGAWS